MPAPKENKNAVGNNGGRPRKFQDVNEFDKLVDEFFTGCENEKKKPTMERLALYLGMDRTTLIEYEHYVEFSDSCKKAKQKCLTWLIDEGMEARNPAMHIFLLKNNYGYKDKQEVELNANINMSEAIKAARDRAKAIQNNQ